MFLDWHSGGGAQMTVGATSMGMAAVNATTCQMYHRGPICAVCEPGCQKDSTGICAPCPTKTGSILYFAGVATAIVAALFLNMYALLQTSAELMHEVSIGLSVLLSSFAFVGIEC